MDPVNWLENVAEGSLVVLLIMVTLALFLDSLAVVGALFPGDLLLLVPSAVVGLPESLIVVLGGVLGTVSGYTLSYSVGCRAGPAIRNSWLGRRVGEHRWVQAERILHGPAGRTLAFVQFMPVLNYLVPLLAGTLKVPLRRFVRLTSIGAMIYCSCYVFLGALAGGTGEAIGESTGRLVGLLAIAVTVAALGFTILTRAVHRVTEDDQDAGGAGVTEAGTKVDVEPPNVAHSSPCSIATAFSSGTGSRCP